MQKVEKNILSGYLNDIIVSIEPKQKSKYMLMKKVKLQALLRQASFLLLLLFGSGITQAVAQTKEVKGTVTDAKGIPLENVTVKLKGSTIATTTLKTGTFVLKVPAAINKPVLVVTSVGYVTREVSAAGSSAIDITLELTDKLMDEVVIIGYGEVKKKDATGSVSKVNITDLQKAPVKSIDEALAGRIAGVRVVSGDGTPDGASEIIVRGVGSITQSSAPLYVIDGFPQESANFNALNPADIESIEVLKDASATAIYGARGSNGVIMITTKRGKSAKPQLSYTGSFGIQSPLKFMELMSPYEFVRLQNDMNPAFANYVYFTNGKTQEDYRNTEGIDWQDLLFEDNPGFHLHNLSLSAKINKTAYSISGSYGEQQGLVLKSGFKRYQTRFSLDQEVTDKLKIGINANYANFKGYGQIPASQSTPPGQVVNNANWNFMTNLWSFRPVLGSRSGDLSFVYEDLIDNNVDEGGVPGSGRVNPYIQTINEVNDRFNTTINANAYLQYKIGRFFTLRSTAGINLLTDESFRFNNSKTNGGSPLTSYGITYGVNGSTNRGKSKSFLNENTLSFRKEFSRKHLIDAVIGATFQKNSNESYGFSASNLPNESLGVKGLGQGTPFQVSSLSSLSNMQSYLGRVNYTFNKNYLFTASVRADGSSKFHPDNRWGYFPSGAFAWKFGSEKFMENANFISDAKIRFSYGATGNNRVSDFAYLSLLSANTSNFSGSYYSWNDQIIYNIVVSTMSNKNLKWEKGVQSDVGLDFALFNKRINVEVDYYNRVTKDLLLNASMPWATGFASAFTNIGKVKNDGLEFTLRTTNVREGNFTWTSDFNISFNRNKLVSLNNGEDALLTTRAFDASLGSNVNYIAKVGQPVAQFYGLIADGMYQFEDFYKIPNGTTGFVYLLKPNIPWYGTQSTLNSVNTNPQFPVQPGDPKFKDLNGDGIIDQNDNTTIGNPYPKHYGGLNNNFSYKNFDLSVFLQWSYGNEILNANRLKFEGGTNGAVQPAALGLTGGGINFNMFATYANRWTPENPSNLYPRANAHAGGTRQYSTRIVEDGSYLRVKTVQLAYNLPVKIIKKAKLTSARFYIAGQNLLTFTKYTGPDPEVSTFSGSNLTPGFDYSPYPRTRVITIGTNITL